MAGYKGMAERGRRARSNRPGNRGPRCASCKKFMPGARKLAYCTDCQSERDAKSARRVAERDPKWGGPEAGELLAMWQGG